MSKLQQYRVVLLPREHEIKAQRINFPKLENLFLHHIENKNKLKPGLPPILETPIIHKEKKKKEPQVIEDNQIEEEEILEKIEEPKKKEVKLPKIKEIPKKGKRSIEDELIEALGESDDEDSEVNDQDEIAEDDEDDQIDEDEDGPVDDEDEDEDEDEVGDEDEEEEGEPDPYIGMTEEQRIAEEIEDYRAKFRLLKRKYPNPAVPIPDFSEYGDLPSMKRAYVRVESELLMEDNIETARACLFGSFVVIELVAVQMDIDMVGFTKSQMAIVYKYEKMLVEIGQRPYYSWSSDLPIEVRLGGYVLLQALLFYIGKIIAEKHGVKIAEFFGMIFGVKPVPTEKKKKKMRGPSISKEDIENMAAGS